MSLHASEALALTLLALEEKEKERKKGIEKKLSTILKAIRAATKEGRMDIRFNPGEAEPEHEALLSKLGYFASYSPRIGLKVDWSGSKEAKGPCSF